MARPPRKHKGCSLALGVGLERSADGYTCRSEVLDHGGGSNSRLPSLILCLTRPGPLLRWGPSLPTSRWFQTAAFTGCHSKPNCPRNFRPSSQDGPADCSQTAASPGKGGDGTLLSSPGAEDVPEGTNSPYIQGPSGPRYRSGDSQVTDLCLSPPLPAL